MKILIEDELHLIEFIISLSDWMCVSYVEASVVSPTSVSCDLILLSAVAEQVSILFHQIKASCDFGPKQTLMCLRRGGQLLL